MKAPIPTAAQLIRALRPHFADTYDLNVAVAAWRRAYRCKNWHAAAWQMVGKLATDYSTVADFLARSNITMKEPA